MTIQAMLVVSIIIIFILLVMEMPVFLAFLSGAFFFIIAGGGSFTWVSNTAVSSLSNFALLAIPLFTLAGNLMDKSGIAAKLVDFCSALLRKVKGGMGAIIPVAAMFFGTISGSGTATCAVLSALLVPRLERMGWDKRYTAALLAASGPLGYMIPPNMNAIMYAVVSNSSVAALFLAGLVPGIVWGLGYVVLNRVMYRNWWHEPSTEDIVEITARQKAQLTASAATSSLEAFEPVELKGTYWGDLLMTFKSGIAAFIAPVIVLGGIYGGIFTATEAGAVGAVYAVIVGFFIYKSFTLKSCYSVFKSTARTMGSMLIILPMVTIFTRILLLNGVPQLLANFFTSFDSRIIILLLIDLIFLISGMFLNTAILIFVLTPLLLPTATVIGLDPIQMGVILFASIGIGTITPPMAMDLFITSKISGVPILNMMKPLTPMIVFVCVPILLLITFLPGFSLWLPSLLGYR